MSFGMTNTGFKPKRFADVLDSLMDRVKSISDPDTGESGSPRGRVVCGRVARLSCAGAVLFPRVPSRTPLRRFPRRRKKGPPRSLGRKSLLSRRWGGYATPPALAKRSELARQTVVHGLVLLLGKADQVPRRPGVLGIIFGWPDVMHGVGVSSHAIPCRLPALPLVAAQDAIAQMAPARCLVTCPHGLSPPRIQAKQKSQVQQPRISA